MDKHQYKKVTFEFPADEYVYLKMACAKQRVSMKEFLTKAVIKSIEEYEDELDLQALRKAKEDKDDAFIPWKEVKKKYGLE